MKRSKGRKGYATSVYLPYNLLRQFDKKRGYHSRSWQIQELVRKWVGRKRKSHKHVAVTTPLASSE